MISQKMYHKILKQCNETNDDNYSNDSPEWSESCEHAMNKALTTAFNVSSVLEANKMRFDIVRNPCKGKIEDLIAGKEVTMVVSGIDMCIPNRIYFYFGMPEVQQAFHENRTNLGYKYSGCFQNSGLNYSIADKHVDMLPTLTKILEHSVPITIFSGEDDGAVPMIGTLRHVKKLASEMNFTLTKDEAWNNENKEGGWLYKFGDLLTFMSVKGANHHVPLSKPSQSLYIFKNHLVEQSD
ncbi:serine carboxypeptidase-like 44 [Gossypium hirsutum]|uniref:Serine carboxypeptidase-like 44 n=1 Tax=Gossypium hirsutum TaxID=3635 RepID=A0ABM2YLC7_GOSHI|nr:serine carboxypeptidase-like 44 [Gossypium hirsutum]